MKPEETSASSSGDANEPSTSQARQEGRQEQQQPQHQVNIDGFDRSTCINRILKELDEIRKHPPPNCGAESYKDDLCRWTAFVNGPAGTAYEGGSFKLDIRFPLSYPFRPPRVRFTTRIYHCNVDSRGAICLDVLNERWSPVMSIAKLLLSIWVLIGECNPDDPLVAVIAEQYKRNRTEHDKIARNWTLRYAKEQTTATAAAAAATTTIVTPTTTTITTTTTPITLTTTTSTATTTAAATTTTTTTTITIKEQQSNETLIHE